MKLWYNNKDILSGKGVLCFMPKAMQYSKGSIIYFEGDMDDRIFILQKNVFVDINNLLIICDIFI